MAEARARAYDGRMLPEQRATSYSHDPATQTVLVVAESETRALQGDVDARLLLDAANHLVGVDLAPDSPDRTVVMLGPHERVARTTDARVRVDGAGRRITIHGHAAKAVALGASPYVP